MIIAHSLRVGTDAVVTPAVYTKSSSLVAVPPGAVTVIFPVEPFPTFAVICVDESMVKEEASVPPNLTPNATPRLAPGCSGRGACKICTDYCHRYSCSSRCGGKGCDRRRWWGGGIHDCLRKKDEKECNERENTLFFHCFSSIINDEEYDRR